MRQNALQGVLPRLLEQIQGAFPLATIYTPPEHAARANKKAWPSMDELLAEGKRVMFVSGEDYGPDMASLLFERKSGTVCGWQVKTNAIKAASVAGTIYHQDAGI